MNRIITRPSCNIGLFLLLLLIQPFALGAEKPTEESIEVAGSIEAILDGQPVVLSSLTSDYDVRISGDLANVTLTQVFSNPYDKPLNARYLFPMNRTAAVHAMQMKVGDEIIVAEIQEIIQAKKTFAKAKQEGKAAALLEQRRPNMFTQRIANLMPGLPIEVEIQYAQTIPKIDGAYELVVPMVVGPRFQPAGAGIAPDSIPDETVVSQAFGQWELEALPSYPATAGVDLPNEIVAERVSLRVTLESPVPLQRVTSATHVLAHDTRSPVKQVLRLAKRLVLDNRDFVLRYSIAGLTESAGVLGHWESGEGGYFSLLIEPPQNVLDNKALSREMVFLLDCSGSMSGLPMNASKAFMNKALNGLRPTDTFRIIRFSDTATEFSTVPLHASPGNIQRGIAYTRALSGGGGTVMTSGIRQALSAPVPDGAVRNVVFLTDGYIGNEIEVLKLTNSLLGDARLYAFGVGAGVNRYLMSELGRVGRGFTRYYDPTTDEETVDAVAADLASKLQTPVLTDIDINWGDLPVTDIAPGKLPDLYAGNSIRVTGRFTEPAVGEATITGRSNQHRATIVSPVSFDNVSERPSVRRIWARTAVAEHMHDFVTPPHLRNERMSDDNLKAAITDLGLSYALVTRWTAFVAVSHQRYNASPENNLDADVALPKVAGVSKLAYAKPTFTGYGAPEPGMVLGLMVCLATLGFIGRRRVKV